MLRTEQQPSVSHCTLDIQLVTWPGRRTKLLQRGFAHRQDLQRITEDLSGHANPSTALVLPEGCKVQERWLT